MGKPPAGRKAKSKVWTKFKRNRANESKVKAPPQQLPIYSRITSPIEANRSLTSPSTFENGRDELLSPFAPLDSWTGSSLPSPRCSPSSALFLGKVPMAHHVDGRQFPLLFPSPLAEISWVPASLVPVEHHQLIPNMEFQFQQARHSQTTTKFVIRVVVSPSTAESTDSCPHEVMFVFIPSKNGEAGYNQPRSNAATTPVNSKKRKRDVLPQSPPTSDEPVGKRSSTPLLRTTFVKADPNQPMNAEKSLAKTSTPFSHLLSDISPISSWQQSLPKSEVAFMKTHVRYIVEESKGEARKSACFSSDTYKLPRNVDLEFDLEFVLHKRLCSEEPANGRNQGKKTPKNRDPTSGGFIGRIYCMRRPQSIDNDCEWQVHSASTIVMLKKEPTEALELSYRFAVWEDVYRQSPTSAKFNQVFSKASDESWAKLLHPELPTRLRTLTTRCMAENGDHFDSFSQSLRSALDHLHDRQTALITDLLRCHSRQQAPPTPVPVKERAHVLNEVVVKQEVLDDFDQSPSKVLMDVSSPENSTSFIGIETEHPTPTLLERTPTDSLNSSVHVSFPDIPDSQPPQEDLQNASSDQNASHLPLFGTDAAFHSENNDGHESPDMLSSPSSDTTSYIHSMMDIDCGSESSDMLMSQECPSSINPALLILSSNLIPPLTSESPLLESVMDSFDTYQGHRPDLVHTSYSSCEEAHNIVEACSIIVSFSSSNLDSLSKNVL